MIVRSLRAENLLKYRHLDLPEVPARGLIGITGENESGKSSIGEAICFALFGRTFAVTGDEPAKLVRWGESRCSVRLGFTGSDGQDYEIRRFLDRDGNQGARLSRAGEPDAPLAKGLATVAEAMERRLGFDFDEYIESFYLAQREITAPHPHSEAVRIMAGVAPLERTRASLEAEIGREADAILDVEGRIADVDRQMQEQGYDPERMQRDATRLEGSRALQGRIDEVAEGLRDAVERFTGARRRIASLKSRTRRAGILGLLFILLGAIGVGAWALSTWTPDTPVAGALRGLLTGMPIDVLGYGGAGALILGALLLLRRLLLGSRLAGARADDAGLRAALDALDALEADLPGEIQTGLAPSADDPGDDSGRRVRLLEGLAGGDLDAFVVQQFVARQLERLSALRGLVEAAAAEVEKDLIGQGERKEGYDKLAAMAEAFRQQIGDHRQRIRVRESARELLTGAAREASHRFNHNLRGLVGKTLPLFTQGRYEHLRIDDNLEVQVFSAEKRDFMDLEEVSSGTQRQIMLALRLALSQELVNRVVKGPQFLFLDEPFAFFDEARTRSALEALPRLSGEMYQIWLVAQELPEDAGFALRVRCRRGGAELSLNI